MTVFWVASKVDRKLAMGLKITEASGEFLKAAALLTLFAVMITAGCASMLGSRQQEDMEILTRKVESLKKEYELSRTNLDARLEQIRNSIAAMEKSLQAQDGEMKRLANLIGAYEGEDPKGPVVEAPPITLEDSAAESVKKPAAPAVADEPAGDEAAVEDLGGPGEIYRLAQDALSQEDYSKAIRLFGVFIKAFPDHQFSDNAQFWIGECYYRAGEFERAIENYNKVVVDFPQGSKASDAVLKIGLLHMRSGNTGAAAEFLKTVVTKYPYSDAALKASDALKSLELSEESAL